MVSLLAPVAATGVLAGAAHASTFVYTSGGGQYSLGAGGLSPLTPATFPLVAFSEGIAAPNGADVYVQQSNGPHIGPNSIGEFSVGSDGTLTQFGTFPGGDGPGELVASPDGQNLYLTNFADGNGAVEVLAVGSGGALSFRDIKSMAGPGTGQNTNGVPSAVVVSPDGKSVYVTDATVRGFVISGGVPTGGSSVVDEYTRAADGTLSLMSTPVVATGADPEGIAISPDGQNVYVTNQQDNTLSQYSVGAGGELAPLTPATVPTGGSPLGVAVSPDGTSVYVADSGGGVSQYTRAADGTLSVMTPGTISTGLNAGNIAVSPDGTSVLVTDRNDVTDFVVGPGGALTQATTTPAPGGAIAFVHRMTSPLTVNAPSASADYGNVPTSFTPTYTGFVNGDTPSSLTTQATCTTTASDTSPPGTYPITCSGASDPNYTIGYGPAGTLAITRAPTNLAAAPARHGLLSITFSATLTRADNSAGVSGKTVAFSVHGNQICHGTTNDSGVASCSVTRLIIGQAYYTATFDGDSDYLASNGNGKL
jgi:DNA-binding beta-propeller fold protein YncE